MIRWCEQGKIDLILTKSISRFARTLKYKDENFHRVLIQSIFNYLTAWKHMMTALHAVSWKK